MISTDRPVTVSNHHGEGVRARIAALLDVSATTLRVAAPVVDLLVRLSLAKTFFDPGMVPSSHVADLVRTGWPMVIAQVTGPALLAAGLLVRPVALVMLALTLLAQASGAPRDEHLFWAALFGWYVVQGAGPLSLDHLLGKGLGLSPLPLAGRAIAAAGWFDRQIGPLYRLALRLWLAAALVGPVLAPAMVPAMAPAMVPATAAAMLPHPVAAIAAVLLALGLGTPVVAAGLLLAGSGAAIIADQGASLYGPLLLALLGVSGAGRYSLDHLVVRLAHRTPKLPDDAPHIVIVGAGFEGHGVRRGAASRASAGHPDRPA